MATTKDRLITLEGLAGYLGVPVHTLYSWRANNKGPRGIRVGRHVRYRAADVEAWLEAQSDPIPTG